MESVVIGEGDRSATDIDGGRNGRDVVIMSRTGASADTSGPNQRVLKKYVAFGTVTSARGPTRDDRR